MVRHLIAICVLAALSVPVETLRASGAGTECSVLRVGGADLWYPYAFRDAETDDVRGIAYDLIDWIGDELGIPVAFGPRVPWARTEILFDHGGLDVIAGVYSGTERWLGRGTLTESFAEDRVSVFVKKGGEFAFSEPEDLIGRQGAALLGVRWGTHFESKRHALSLQEVQKHEQVLQMVLRGRVEYGVMPYYTGVFWSSRIDDGEHLTTLSTPISVNPIHFVIAQNSPCADLLERINGLIAKARQTGILDRLVMKHTPMS